MLNSSRTSCLINSGVSPIMRCSPCINLLIMAISPSASTMRLCKRYDFSSQQMLIYLITVNRYDICQRTLKIRNPTFENLNNVCSPLICPLRYLTYFPADFACHVWREHEPTLPWSIERVSVIVYLVQNPFSHTGSEICGNSA
jgi:hypothetical protein